MRYIKLTQVLTCTRVNSVVHWLHVRVQCNISMLVCNLRRLQVVRERVNRVKDWIAVALPPGRRLVPSNLETLGCAFAG